MTRALVWMQNDLRIQDNTALYHASHYADEGVAAIYFISENVWREQHAAACKVDFILKNLHILSRQLQQYNISLLIRYVSSLTGITEVISEIVSELKIDALFFNKQYEVDESNCQEQVGKKLQLLGCKVFSYEDQTILSPHKVLTQQNTPYTIFTPFKKSWQKKFLQEGMCVFPAIKKTSRQLTQCDQVPDALPNFFSSVDSSLWPAGEEAAHQRLENFLTSHLDRYHKERDFPSLSGTSQLSPYLTVGVISPRQCLQRVLEYTGSHLCSLPEGAQVWVNELIWREFYKQVLLHFPRVSKHKPFKLATDKIIWGNNLQFFKAWKQGKTGYPIIDAAMRQLQQTGWMHNRLRMIVAMFLVKNLFIDWRWGEKFFMLHLIDGDLAANNGGWQWSASTGTDSVPYFRIFNPILQSQKYDPQGVFIKKYCPELINFSGADIHTPYASDPWMAQSVAYPMPITGLTDSRERVLTAFSVLK